MSCSRKDYGVEVKNQMLDVVVYVTYVVVVVAKIIVNGNYYFEIVSLLDSIIRFKDSEANGISEFRNCLIFV